MNSKMDRVKVVLENVRLDCEELTEKGEFSERGKGQLDVVRLIEQALKE